MDDKNLPTIIRRLSRSRLDPLEEISKEIAAIRRDVRDLKRPELDYMSALSIAEYMLIPELRFFHPFSVRNTTASPDAIVDISGAGQDMPIGGTGNSFGVYNGQVGYWEGAGAAYLTRTVEQQFRWSADFSVGCYVWFDLATISTIEQIMNRSDGTATGSSWELWRDTDESLNFSVFALGVPTTVTHEVEPVNGVWNFVGARYDEGNSLDINLNGVWTENTSSIPSTINDSGTLNYGALVGLANTEFIDGRLSFAFGSEYYLDDDAFERLRLRTAGLFI